VMKTSAIPIKCDLCGKDISGSYLIFNGQILCGICEWLILHKQYEKLPEDDRHEMDIWDATLNDGLEDY